MSPRWTRREVLERSAWVAAGALAAASGLAATGRRSRVVLVRRKELLAGGEPSAGLLGSMLDEAVCALLDERTPEDAWRRIVQPDDVVGIKSNEWERLPTPPALEQAMRARVLAAGVAESAVGIDDRGVRRNPLFARATALLNVRPMRTHSWSGLGTCLKNYIMFAPRPADYHPNGCEDLGAVWKLPLVAGKTRLNVLVMLTPQFHSLGPHFFSRTYTWPYGGLIVGREPAAVDAVGRDIILAKRLEHFGEDRPIAPPPHHIRVADERHGLGPSTMAGIELIRLGEGAGILLA